MRVVIATLVVLSLFAIPAWADGDKPEAEPTEKSIEDRVSDLESAMDSVIQNSGIEFYGHIKLDMARDSSRTNAGNTAMWVLPYKDGKEDPQTNLTARHSRFGLNYTAPESWGPAATGKIEFDFYGGGAENKANVRLRHAYLNLDFQNGWSLLAGQTWDVIMPLWQWKLNTAVGWNQGNSAFRRAQLRGTYEGKAGESTGYKFAFAIADPIGIDTDDGNVDDAEDAAKADLQGRFGLSFPLFAEKAPFVIGLNGMYGWREADFEVRKDRKYNAWLLGIDLTIPITKDMKILCELFTGSSLALYAAGIAQSYNTKLRTEIDTSGGFVNFHWKLDKLWFLVLGAGVDDPRNSNLNEGNRSRNQSIFGNLRFKITKQVWVGLEFDWMVTEYQGKQTARNNRIQMSFCLKF